MGLVSSNSVKALYVACGALYGHCRIRYGGNIVVAVGSRCDCDY